jgi:hypothetical protein
MPQYQCATCKEVFLHLAKQIRFAEPKDIPITEDTTIKAGDSLETYICPLCGSKRYTEVVEEKQGTINLADVSSLIDCPPCDANKYLQEGYVLFQTWQKNCFLVKLKSKEAGIAPKTAEPNDLGSIIQAGIADAKAKTLEA